MKWKNKKNPDELRETWQKHFAFWPVTIDNTKVWLKTVERKGKFKFDVFGGEWLWQYRELSK